MANTLAPASEHQSRASMGLPDQFIGKPRRPLRISQSSKLPFEAEKPNLKAPHWNVPAAGGFGGGFKTGAEIAFAVLKQRRSVDFQQANKFQLADIMESLIARHAQVDKSDKKASSALRGQTRAFISILGAAVDNYLQCDDTCHEVLDNIPMDQILSDANRGLGLKVNKYESWLYGNDNSEKAPHALVA